MGILDNLAKKGGYESKSRGAWINKDRQYDVTLEIQEAKLIVSENPKYEGNEIVVVSFAVSEDRAGTVEAGTDNSAVIQFNLDKGTPNAQKKMFEEAATLVAVIAGIDRADIFANPLQLRELLEDTEAFAGKQLVLTSLPEKGGYHNHRWELPAAYEARMSAIAKGSARMAPKGGAAKPTAEPVADEQPAPVTRPGKAKGKAAQVSDDDIPF